MEVSVVVGVLCVHGGIIIENFIMLLHPCECNIQFTSTKGCRPMGEVLVNHRSVITNLFHIEAIRYTHYACSEAQGV